MGDSGMHELSRAGEGVEGSALGPVYSVAGNLADELGARGPVVSISNACAAGAYAVAEAVQLLETGECDVVLACGAESYSRVALGAFNRMGAIDPTSCRPFSADRRGTVFGEGAAVLVLERADGARARGVTALASVIGYGLTCDADHPTAPDPEGAQAQRAMEQALRRAGLTASDVHAVVPHGTGTGHNDLAESAVLQRVLGRADLGPPVYSLKALLGHTGGAAGALAAVAAVEISRRRTVPGNVDVGVLDEACPVNLPVGSPVGTGGGHVLVNAYAFGGNNASILLGDAA
jgi:3-oxoacyl-[acyl-carrier-protein] synthase II